MGCELAAKKAKLADLTARYTEMVPEVIRTKQEVADLEKRIAEAQRSASNLAAEDPNADSPIPVAGPPLAMEEIRRMRAQLKAARAEIASLKKEKGEIRKTIADVEQKIEQSPRREQEMISLIRDYENQKNSYDDLLKKKLEADVSQNLEKRQKGTQFQILDPANLPEAPFQPDRKKVMGVSLLLALVLGFGGTIAWEAMDLRLRDVRDFRHLYKVPILGYIPVFQDQQYPAGASRAPGGGLRRTDHVHHGVFHLPAGVPRQDPDHPELLAEGCMKIPFLDFYRDRQAGATDRYTLFQSKDQIFTEQYKNFSARFEYAVDTRGCKVVAISSAVAGEGKTVSTVNLASNLASTGRKKVLLIDLDLRKSDLAKGLRFPSIPGLVELLEGTASLNEVLRFVIAQGLHVIPSGKRVSNPWGLLSGEKFRIFLQELRDQYDVILLDTAPMLPVSDTLVLRDLVDGIVLVHRLGYTPHNLFRQALEDIGEKKLLGVLLNGVEPQSERYYRKYYGKYYTKPDTQ